jgi:hypothetical protein
MGHCQLQYEFGGGATYNTSLDSGHSSSLLWYPGGNVWGDGLESPMFLYVSNGRQNRADDYKSFLGLSIFEYHFNPGFEPAPVRLSTGNIERSINPVAHNLISGGALDRKPAGG